MTTELCAGIVIKAEPDDFRVDEVPLSAPSTIRSNFPVARLNKAGLTTEEVAQRLADVQEVPRKLVTFAGRKDEDGVTSQFMVIGPLDDASIDTLRPAYAAPDGSWSFEMVGFAQKPLSFADLRENCFSVRLRNASDSTWQRLATSSTSPCRFINYYDTQRFGFPGKPKVTHIVGKALLNNDLETALQGLCQLEGPDSDRARQHRAPANSFFEDLPLSNQAFLRSAYSSFLWNAAVRAEVESCGGEVVHIEGHDYRFAPTERLGVLEGKAHEYIRYQIAGERLQPQRVDRRLIIDVRFVADVERRELCFSLPTGTYATMFLRQLLWNQEVANG